MVFDNNPTILIVGASRGLGYAMAEEFVTRGWSVIGTIRGRRSHSGLHDLASRYPQQVRVEVVDIDDVDTIVDLRSRLSDRRLDILFVNAGTTTGDPLALVDQVSDAEFVRVMCTNTLGPMRVIEALKDRVPADGLIGAMSSGQGSIANNEKGTREVYRASKAALNMLMRCFAAREREQSRSIAVMAPGWIQTDLGGPDAPYTIEEAVPPLVDVLLAKRTRPGLEYLDRFGDAVPW
ncbi:SDR family oxidoreductase [Stakelama sediminis]|uniref:NAD(P)-dependent dehydrogenase (Short-subunit alcohol dehydrogenase family) n=1 Tax=Stakelama sediminis TaxID=463200 RepID=A0A840YVV9_9SPHN|nr:SDR family NAD(P)-dependent oxidoreductase [Stakelama sediminis]MBB5717674.1 NAD(P)-dependent dehydrogenase (short-subunit alcohol dehydrogenase family) [Stakelama sediminis]